MKSTIVKEVTVELRGKKVIAKFPNIGQTIQIENMKQILSDGRYAIMAYSGMKSTNKMLDIIDCISYMSNVIVDFYPLLGISNHTDLLNMDEDSLIMVELLAAYHDVYLPFFTELYTRTDRPEEEVKKAKEESDKTE